ncbi:unnamed protein product [Miscanthus lutarioriparius]|uniref:Uncharacterized protein n=1 Tax=Miscanthus lutarioriparius TaxID=422564 RepID=A0A811NYV0_9POAL|nr:unnamed protein product [Miscanthus lutarioriparius]
MDPANPPAHQDLRSERCLRRAPHPHPGPHLPHPRPAPGLQRWRPGGVLRCSSGGEVGARCARWWGGDPIRRMAGRSLAYGERPPRRFQEGTCTECIQEALAPSQTHLVKLRRPAQTATAALSAMANAMTPFLTTESTTQ